MTVSIETRDDAIAWELKPDWVRADARAAAQQVRAAVCRQLELTPPTIRWLSPLAHVRGQTLASYPGEIWVKEQPPAAVADTVAHELRHVKQIRTCSPLDMHEREVEADRFGREVRRRWEAGLPQVDTPAPAPPGGRARAAAAPAPRRAAAPAARAEPAQMRYTATTTTPAELAVAARRAGFFAYKGLTFWRCEPCGAATPCTTTHRCPVARQQAKRWPYWR